METTTASSNSTAEPQKLSKIGEWMRKHPHGLEGVVVADPRILDGLSIFDILYAKHNEVPN